jgi:hypothetical protein
MKRIALALSFLIAVIAAASAQNVTVIGPITPGDLPQFSSTTVIKDSGVAGGAALLPNSVKNFGALGNSNGTTGNGHDDTAAISAALDSGDAYVPCGIYRITSTITKTGTTTQYRIHGEGFCSKIYLDTGTTQPAFNFSPASACGPCVRVERLNFITPTTVGVSTSAVSLTNETQAVFSNNYISSYQIGVSLTASFAPFLVQNQAQSLTGSLLFVAGADKSLNNAKIWGNTVQSSGITATSAVLPLACNGANNISVLGNDLEGNYIGAQFASCTSVDFSDNYVENSTATNLFFSGTNVGFTVRNNWFGTSPATAIANVSKMLFGANTIFGWAITWASTATGVILEPTNDLLSGGSIGALTTPALSACGTGSPSMVGTRLAGQVTEGTTATGCTLTFELPFDVKPSCVVAPSSVAALAISNLSASLLTVTNTSGTGGIFTYVCQAY